MLASGRSGQRMGGGGKEKDEGIPKNGWGSEKNPFEWRPTLWDFQNLQKKKKSEKGGGGDLVRGNGCSHVY